MYPTFVQCLAFAAMLVPHEAFAGCPVAYGTSCSVAGTNVCSKTGSNWACDLSDSDAGVTAVMVDTYTTGSDFEAWGTYTVGTTPYVWCCTQPYTGVTSINLTGTWQLNDTLGFRDNATGAILTRGLAIAHGEAGNDTIRGSFWGGSGYDEFLYGDGGNDTISCENGDDYAFGGDGDDTLFGGLGEDHLYGGDDDDVMMGGAGNDTMYGEDGVDQMAGGDDDDEMDGGLGRDAICGDSGYKDTLLAGDNSTTSDDILWDLESGTYVECGTGSPTSASAQTSKSTNPNWVGNCDFRLPDTRPSACP